MNKYTHDQIRDMIEIEGFGYTFEDYLSADNIEDDSLADLVKEYVREGSFIERFLSQGTGSEIDLLSESIDAEGLDYTLTEKFGSFEDDSLGDLVHSYKKRKRAIEDYLGL